MPAIKCQLRTNVECNQRWHQLATIDKAKRIRHCDTCHQSVHWCDNASEVEEAARHQRCIAAHRKTLREAGITFDRNPDSSLWVGGVECEYKE